MPSGPRSHFWAGTEYISTPSSPTRNGIAPAAWGECRDAVDRHQEPGRPEHVRDRHEARARHNCAIERAEDVVIGRVAIEGGEPDVDAESLAKRVERPQAAGVLMGRRDSNVTGLPVDRPRADVHPVARGMGQGDLVELRSEHRRHGGPGFVDPDEELLVVRDVGPADVPLVLDELRQRCDRIDGHRAARAGVQLDPGCEGWEGRPDGSELLRVRHERGNHGPMIRAMQPFSGGVGRP